MMMNNKNTPFKINRLALAVLMIIFCDQAQAVDFNTDVLDAADRKNIDIGRFSQAGYIMPGQYQMQVMVNDQSISPSAFTVSVEEPAVNSAASDKKALPQACLTTEMVDKMGLTTASREKVTFRDNGRCADFSALPGVEIRTNPAEGILYINMPQAWLEYSDASWLPPSRWDNGIPGLLFDYNINGSVNKPHQGKESQYVSYNGTTGANLGAWRFRADYQGYLSHTTGQRSGTDNQFDWSRFYLYRALPRWQSKLTLGENYTSSEIFSTWRYTGASLESDDRMLPPKLRGYAPQITGMAGRSVPWTFRRSWIRLSSCCCPVVRRRVKYRHSPGAKYLGVVITVSRFSGTGRQKNNIRSKRKDGDTEPGDENNTDGGSVPGRGPGCAGSNIA